MSKTLAFVSNNIYIGRYNMKITSNCNLFSINETDVRNNYYIKSVGPFFPNYFTSLGTKLISYKERIMLQPT